MIIISIDINFGKNTIVLPGVCFISIKLYSNGLSLLFSLGTKSFGFIFVNSIDLYVSHDYPRAVIFLDFPNLVG